jgi:hypothetical protein
MDYLPLTVMSAPGWVGLAPDCITWFLGLHRFERQGYRWPPTGSYWFGSSNNLALVEF